jgi:endonuclease/exonuclease/phosphatase (EEP) superfamily protein YafD
VEFILSFSEKIRRRTGLAFQCSLFALVAACGLLTICAGFESVWWRAYEVAQLRIQIAIASGFLALVLVSIPKMKKSAAIPAFIAILNGAYFLPVYIPRTTNGTNEVRSLRLLQINLNNLNTNHDAVVEYVRSSHPDILLITELTDAWKNALSNGLREYKHSVLVPRQDTYGIGIYSVVELMDADVKYYGSSGHPTVVCKIFDLGKPITLVHTHLQGPVKPTFFEWHKEQLLLMTEELQKLKTPLVVAGDMNCTPWTYLSSDLLRKCNLEDSRRGFGLQLTWPAPNNWRKVPIVLLPIDHCFVSPEISIRKRIVGPFVGSDHYPVLVELELPNRSLSEGIN